MSILIPYGLPGVGTARTAAHRRVFRGNIETFLPGGGVINGTYAGDPDNSPAYVLRPGLLMGRLTSGGLWGSTILGVVQSAYTSGGTSLTVTAAQAVEIARRVGSSGSGTLKAIGPPTAAGTVATTSVTFSAVAQTTGIITVTSLGVDKVAGTLITAADGTEAPLSFIPDGYGVRCADADGTRISASFPQIPTAGEIHSANLINWPSDTSLQAWVVAALNGAAGGQFDFDHRLVG